MQQRFLTSAAAVATGVVMAAALPPWGWWPLAFVALAGFDRLIAEQATGTRFRRGMLVGLGLYVPSLVWMVDMTMPGYVIAVVAYAALWGVAACRARRRPRPLGGAARRGRRWPSCCAGRGPSAGCRCRAWPSARSPARWRPCCGSAARCCWSR